MRKRVVAALVLPVAALAIAAMVFIPVAASATPATQAQLQQHKKHAHHPHIMPLTHHRYPGTNVPAAGPNDLQYGGGPVMTGTMQVYAIFWEPSGSSVSANYNSLITRYFGDVGGTGLYNNNSQYTDTSGSAPTTATLAGSWVDTAAYPSGTLLDTDIQNEVTNAINTKGWSPSITTMFFVYTAQNENICIDSSQSQCSFTTFCGYHNYFGSNTIYAAMPYVGGVQGCSTPSSPNNDDADSTINVTSHEQMEAATDPLLNAWTDTSGQEIGDKCNFTFGTTASDGSDVSWHSNPYLVQEEYDNAQSGCVISGP